MLRNRLLLLSLLLLASRLWAQDATASPKLTALFSVAVVPIKGPQLALQPGLQWRLHRWSFEANTTFLLQQPRDHYGYVQYWRNSLDIKHYLQQTRNDAPYGALSFAYAQRTFGDTSSTFFKRDRSDRYWFSKARIHSPVATIALKGGEEIKLGKHVTLDAFGGIGVRIVYTRYDDLENVSTYYDRWFGHIGPLSAYRYDKTITRLHLTGGVRLGYVLW